MTISLYFIFWACTIYQIINLLHYADQKISNIGISDIPTVGGKNASLGEIYNQLTPKDVRAPNGFATTSKAFWKFLKENEIRESLENIISGLDRNQYTNLNLIGERARSLILKSEVSNIFSTAICDAYSTLCEKEGKAVAVRSSATAEDSPDASFAGQHDTFLNVKGKEAVLQAVKKCFASLYTDHAIKYREDKGFLHEDVALSDGLQLMVRSDKGCS